MCGIAGCVSWGPRAADARVATAMALALAHRGPDGIRAWEGEVHLGPEGAPARVAIGHSRLRVIDLRPVADQPLSSEDGQVLVVANGEVYNHARLRRWLEAGGHRFRSRCDCEALVHLYEEVGEDLARHLRGMYAFAIVDRRAGRIVLARDPAGKKPLFWALLGDAFLFASEPRALLEAGAEGGPEVPRTLDADAVAAHLAVGYIPASRSAFAEIRQVLPGETLVLERGRVRRILGPAFGRSPERGGERPDEADVDDARTRSGRDAASAMVRVRRAVIDAVAARLESDVPLGAFLSGGVDSAIVSAVASRLLGRRLRTFSIGFEEPRWDESAHAAAAAKHLGTEHVGLRLADDAARSIPEVVWRHGAPYADESAIAVHHLAALARRDVTVVLTGDGGDELFAGYRHHRVARALRALDAIVPRSVRAILGRAAPAPGGEKTRRLQLHRLLASLPRSEPERYLLWTGLFPERGREVAERVADAGGIPGYELAVYLPDDLLAKLDRASMAVGLEARCPLLDRRLAALAASLPERRKADAPWRGKAILLRAFRDVLPPGVGRRPKMGFGVPITVWLRRAPLRDLVRDTLLARRALERPDAPLPPREVERLLDEHDRGARDHARRIHALVTLELFRRMYVDPRRPARVEW